MTFKQRLDEQAKDDSIISNLFFGSLVAVTIGLGVILTIGFLVGIVYGVSWLVSFII